MRLSLVFAIRYRHPDRALQIPSLFELSVVVVLNKWYMATRNGAYHHEAFVQTVVTPHSVNGK